MVTTHCIIPGNTLHSAGESKIGISTTLSYLWQKHSAMSNNERYPENFKKIWRASFLGIAIVWVLMIFAAAKALQGTGYLNKLVPIFGIGAAAIIIILTAILRRYL